MASIFRDPSISPIKSWSDMTLREIKKHAANNGITPNDVDGDKRCRKNWIRTLASAGLLCRATGRARVGRLDEKAPGSPPMEDRIEIMLQMSFQRQMSLQRLLSLLSWPRYPGVARATRVIQRAWRAKKEEEEEKKKTQIALEAVKKLDYDILFTNLCDWDYIGNDEFKLDISDKAGNFHRYNYYENEGKTVWRRGPRNAKGVCAAKPVGAWVGNE